MSKQQTLPPAVPAIAPKGYTTIKVLDSTWTDLKTISEYTGQSMTAIVDILVSEELKRQHAARQQK